MNNPRKRNFISVVVVVGLAGGGIHAQTLNTPGVTLLRAATTNLNGTGIPVAQVEAYNGDNGSTNAWEVNPTNAAPGAPLFTYISGLGTSTNFPNSVGDWSSHAESVGSYFYGFAYGVATNVAHVNNYDANYYVQLDEIVIGPMTNWSCSLTGAIGSDRIVNQSFISAYVPSQIPVAAQQAIDLAYDTYAATNNTLFVSGAGNGGPNSGTVAPPSTCYNGIAVGAYGSTISSVGPTPDNSRCKPDITTPALAGTDEFFHALRFRSGGGADAGGVARRRRRRHQCRHGHSHGEGTAAERRGQAVRLDEFEFIAARYALWRGRAERFQFL